MYLLYTPPRGHDITLNGSDIRRNYYRLASISFPLFLPQSLINPLELLDFDVFCVLVWVPLVRVLVFLYSTVSHLSVSRLFFFSLFAYSLFSRSLFLSSLSSFTCIVFEQWHL